MKWVLVDSLHINLENVDAFEWHNGKLIFCYNGDPNPYPLDDPEKRHYLKLCHQLGVRPYEETEVIADGSA